MATLLSLPRDLFLYLFPKILPIHLLLRFYSIHRHLMLISRDPEFWAICLQSHFGLVRGLEPKMSYQILHRMKLLSIPNGGLKLHLSLLPPSLLNLIQWHLIPEILAVAVDPDIVFTSKRYDRNITISQSDLEFRISMEATVRPWDPIGYTLFIRIKEMKLDRQLYTTLIQQFLTCSEITINHLMMLSLPLRIDLQVGPLDECKGYYWTGVNGSLQITSATGGY